MPTQNKTTLSCETLGEIYAERDRLREVNAELLAALKACLADDADSAEGGLSWDAGELARAAIAHAEEAVK
jgi:hypothetical protein